MQYTPLVPAEPPLAGCIDTLFVLDDYCPDHPRERVVPDGKVNLIIELDDRERFVFDNVSGEPIQRCKDAWLAGVFANYLTIGDTRAGSTLAVTQFSLGRARALLHQDLSHFNDRVVPAGDVLGSSVVELRVRLSEATDPATRLAMLKKYWEERYDPELDAPPVIRSAVQQLRASPGGVAVTRLAENQAQISHRHFLNLFKKHVGPTPKRLQRILRFSQVFERVQAATDVEWAQISIDLGYSDQAHFIRDFVEFSGFRPQEYLKLGHDRLNFFPEDER